MYDTDCVGAFSAYFRCVEPAKPLEQSGNRTRLAARVVGRGSGLHAPCILGHSSSAPKRSDHRVSHRADHRPAHQANPAGIPPRSGRLL